MKQESVTGSCGRATPNAGATAAAKTATADAKNPKDNSNNKKEVKYGLTTRIALARLHDDILQIVKTYEIQFGAESCYRKVRSAFVKRYDSPLGWFAIATSTVAIIALLAIESFVTALCLSAILSLDLFVVIRENNLRRTEIYRKTRHILAEIKLAEEELCGEWQACNYPHLCCPISPCVSLQWTYRDGVIVNMPWALLVRGDHIVLRPGQITPGPCTEVAGKKSFGAHEIYGVSQVNDPPIKPMARAPLSDLVCCLENTPYLDNLKIILDNSLKRPPTIYNQQRYLLVSKYIQQWGFISAVSLTVFIGIMRMNGVGMSPSESEHIHWTQILIESPVAAVIPLLPLMFPIMWISMNLWGIARLQSFLKTPQMLLPKDSEKSFEEDLDTPAYDYDNISLMRSNVFKMWLRFWRGESELLPRSANVVQVLGSITALCCVDKKGILSWPNPTAEKVFFLHDTESDDADDRSTNDSSVYSESDEPVDQQNKQCGIVAEVLDLTHDQHCPFRLEFDDHDWKMHIKSLKPLGLAILLNTCSPLTHTHYAQFCGHVTAVAMLDKDLVPVTNRYAIVESSMNSFLHGRCLCELAKQIGFTDHATDRFSLEGQLASYRHLQPDVVRRDIRFARQLQLSSKVKVPFPHSLSVVMRENPGGYLSLFTQGTADIILDCCDDFWDGKDLRQLSQQDRKRALDFYQRSALTAYCTAFAYRPLRHGIHGALSGSQQGRGPIAYLELPPESKIRMQHIDKTHCDFEGHTKLSHSISTDSLLFSESKDDDINDVEGCFEMQCHQVFIGMVTMQYQAQTDIVQLVERLERACIRFVHFSKENELRSRVFSEKMGLESGWNCHISLLSEADDQRSANAVPTQSPKNSGNFDNTNTASTIINITCSQNKKSLHQLHDEKPKSLNANAIVVPGNGGGGGGDGGDNGIGLDEYDINCLLPPANLESTKTLSSSAPGAISNHDYNMFSTASDSQRCMGLADSLSNGSTAASHDSLNITHHGDHSAFASKTHHRQSQDSAMDENCRSVSVLTESTEQSAPVHFDMSNRAKLPRGIENIRPHLEKVDNVPLQVSLFTDCSAEATREMLSIMQSYGEIVVCMGSSASNANAEIFLQADCSIAVEPLYPQVCQDIPAYTETNIYNNKLRLLRLKEDGTNLNTDNLACMELLEGGGINSGVCAQPMQSLGNTVSPIYLSRLLNSLPCSISVCRDDPLSTVAIIELSRRFSSGLWNCIQFWACCAGSLSILNILSACLSLPPILTPLTVIYLMCIPVPLIALALAHIDVDPKTMSRATGKKQTEYDSRVFVFVVWCYGCKFLSPILILILAYCTFMAHPLEIMDVDEDNLRMNLKIARIFCFLGILLHFVIVSASFVHRDHSMWQKNPFRNLIWTFTCFCILLVHSFICMAQVLLDEYISQKLDDVWPAIVFLYCGAIISLIVTEICKWQEIKRCLCELAKQIGFTDHATDRFSLEGQLASYRHLQPDVVRRDIRFARQLQLSSKVKVPFPHSLSVVMRENPGGYLSLFTQGTADIILDCCDDFWDGKDLRQLSQQDRKRALDFYQRSALTAYCTAFAYRPLRHGIHGALSGSQQGRGPIAYLELPPESKIRMQHIDKTHCDFEGHTKLSHSISTDSLLFSESKDDDINDVEGCFEMQCHQVFIGMVTMQYQAQTDIVQLVERLERACIRFVHFSKENELRSRVFSEKMGLESGWNCHISLLSEADDQRSANAVPTQSPKNSGNGGGGGGDGGDNGIGLDEYDINCLLPPANLESTKTLSSSAPGAISNHDYNMFSTASDSQRCMGLADSLSNGSTAASHDSLNITHHGDHSAFASKTHHRQSQDSAMDENCRSVSVLTESTEQSAPVHFDMSNRAKLPRGIENIRPHLEKVDNVPLQVSLFTDCSAEATREMLSIMQSYGEIVVCMGSSASNANAEIFLQADCSIAVEPLYPQVCQDIPAYTETNIYNNKLRLLRLKEDGTNLNTDNLACMELLEGGGINSGVCAQPMQSLGNTVSPIYLSRLLNSLPCSISVCRDDPLSTVAIIELSRRFSSGLWNCIQFWACCAGSLSILNILSACLSLPPILTPLTVIYLMCIPVPLIALALAHIDVDPKTMSRATGKKQTEYDSRVFVFVVWCYGCKFLSPILILILAYCTFMAHPLEIMDVDEDNLRMNLKIARIFCFLGILLHFVIVSASFVHRDHSMWQKNPFRNLIWTFTCFCILLVHSFICMAQVLLDEYISQKLDDVWPAIVFLYCGAIISLIVTEICKWQEIKVNTRYQRRARLDFGTKLGMNSPF